MKELEDHSWFPEFLRTEQSEFIGNMAVASGIFKPFIKHLKTSQKQSRILHDLCSGSGIPSRHIFHSSDVFNSLILSDKFPANTSWSDTKIQYISASTDVLNMSFDKHYCYMMLNAYHHFNTEEQNDIIKRCEEADAELYIIEILEPTLTCLIKVILAGTAGVLLLSPFIGKMTWRKLLFTYIIPLNILTISIDGIISVFKSKSKNQFKNQIADFAKKTEVMRLNSVAGPTTIIHISNGH